MIQLHDYPEQHGVHSQPQARSSEPPSNSLATGVSLATYDNTGSKDRHEIICQSHSKRLFPPTCDTGAVTTATMRDTIATQSASRPVRKASAEEPSEETVERMSR